MRGREADGAILAESERRSYRYIGYIFIHCPDPQRSQRRGNWMAGHVGTDALQAERTGGESKWKMELGNKMEMETEMENAGYLAWLPLLTPGVQCHSRHRVRGEWKRMGRREDGRTGSLREYLRVGATQTRKSKREEVREGGCPGRPAISLVCCRSVCPRGFSRWTIAWIPSPERGSAAGLPCLIPFSATTGAVAESVVLVSGLWSCRTENNDGHRIRSP